MKYFFDTEFLEGTQLKRVPFINLSYGKTKNTIDLISIGIVAEDGREYYAISKDFNLKEAWERFQYETQYINEEYLDKHVKIYWIRDNIILPIVYELATKDYKEKGFFMIEFGNYNNWLGYIKSTKNWEKIWYKRTKELLNKYGKTNQQIAKEIQEFCKGYPDKVIPGITIDDNIEFYAYYADYDWVVFCWLFGKMIDLPKGFPMYCQDLKQILDEKVHNYHFMAGTIKKDFKTQLEEIKAFKSYPKQTNEHNALDDARWNRKLYNFLNTI